MQRHPDHHVHARRRFQVQRQLAHSPQLPAGYGLMVPLALVPWLWRRVMDSRLDAFLARQAPAVRRSAGRPG